jgi:hypothetical protein
MSNPIKPLDEIGLNWVEGTAGATGRLERGIRNPKRQWRTNTIAAEANYNAGVQAAIATKRFSRGVAKVSQSDYQEITARKAVERWPGGVAVAVEKYKTGFSPYATALANQTLSPRGPRRSAANRKRMDENVVTMINKKEELLKAGA